MYMVVCDLSYQVINNSSLYLHRHIPEKSQKKKIYKGFTYDHHRLQEK